MYIVMELQIIQVDFDQYIFLESLLHGVVLVIINKAETYTEE